MPTSGGRFDHVTPSQTSTEFICLAMTLKVREAAETVSSRPSSTPLIRT